MSLTPLRLICSVFVAVGISYVQSAHGNTQLVKGLVLNPAGVPIPGLVVSIASKEYRTQPAITKSDGSFEIELTLDGTSRSFIEIYWGKELMYRKPLDLPTSGSTQLPVITIPPISLGVRQ